MSGEYDPLYGSTTTNRKIVKKHLTPGKKILYYCCTLKPSSILNVVTTLVFYLALLGLLIGVIQWRRMTQFPEVKHYDNLSDIPKTIFSEQRTQVLLEHLTTEIGTRVIYTEGNKKTKQWIIEELQKIEADRKSWVKWEWELQEFNISQTQMTKLTNIVLRISDVHKEEDVNDQPALMLSSHYDSTFPSLGGVDDGQAVVSLIELARVVTNQDGPLEKPLIFMFNNGEENGLDGGRAFKDHPWHNAVSRFINLESTGANNMPIMFRLGPGSLAHELYESSPFNIHANVMGEDLINILPSDTDFTAYYLEQSVPGFDYAYYMNGYSYHTENDNNQRMNTGSMQYLGDHTLGQIEYYCRSAKSPLGTTPSTDRFVYFDVLSMVLVSYPELISQIIVPCVAFIGLIVPILSWILDFLLQQRYYKLLSKFDSQEETPRIFLKKHKLPTSKLHVFRGIIVFLYYIIVYGATMIAGIVTCIALSYLLDYVNPLSWYANPGLAYAFYGCVALATTFFILGIMNFIMVVAFRAVRRRRLFKSYMDFESINVRFMNRFTRERYYAMSFLFSAISVVTLFTRIRASYILHIPSVVFVLSIVPAVILERIFIVIYVLTVVKNDVKSNFDSDSTTELSTFDETSKKSYRDLYQSYNTGTGHDSEDDDDVHEQVLARYSKILRDEWYVRLSRYLFIKHRPLYFVSTLLSTIFLILYMDLISHLLPTFMPMLGRTILKFGNPDFIVAAAIAFSVIFIFFFAAPQFGNVGNFSKFASLFTVLSIGFGITLLIIFPYNADHPKRISTKNIFDTRSLINVNVVTNEITHDKSLKKAYVAMSSVDANKLHNTHALFNELTYNHTCSENTCNIEMDYDLSSDVVGQHSLSNLKVISMGNTTDNLYKLQILFDYPIHYSTVIKFHVNTAIKSIDTLNDLQKETIYNDYPNFYKLNVANNQTIFNLDVTLNENVSLTGEILLTECEMDAVPFTRDFFAAKDWALVNGQGFCDYTKSNIEFTVTLEK